METLSTTIFERSAQIGETVFFHHGTDGKTYPAIVSDVRALSALGGPYITPYTHTREDVVNEEKNGLTFYAHLTILRPGHIEWRWAVESTEPGGFVRGLS